MDEDELIGISKELLFDDSIMSSFNADLTSGDIINDDIYSKKLDDNGPITQEKMPNELMDHNIVSNQHFKIKMK